jgi:hypothetical protein
MKLIETLITAFIVLSLILVGNLVYTAVFPVQQVEASQSPFDEHCRTKLLHIQNSLDRMACVFCKGTYNAFVNTRTLSVDCEVITNRSE